MAMTPELTFISVILGAVVALITIVSTILGVGWKLGKIASGIRLEIAEIKGMMGVSSERIAQLERRVESIEKTCHGNAASCRRKAKTR
jgi:hypothetical protein